MFLTVNGARYHIETIGAGVPILLLHGFTGALGNWFSLSDTLRDQYQVVAVDLLGHGQTDSPTDSERYRMEQAAADLIALVKTLKLDRPHLLGYSMGGRLALYTALHYAVFFRSLILESASPGLETEAERQSRRASDNVLADRIEREGIPAFVDYWESIPLFASQLRLPESQRGILRQQRLNNQVVGLANSLRGMGTGMQPSLWDRLSRLSLPVLLLAGELDAKFTAITQQMQRSIPASELRRVPDAGHTVHLEQPHVYAQHILRWLADHDSP